MGFERPLRKQSSGLFSGRGRIHGTQAAAPKSRRQVPFWVSRILRVETPQNAFDPDLTQTGKFSEYTPLSLLLTIKIVPNIIDLNRLECLNLTLRSVDA